MLVVGIDPGKTGAIAAIQEYKKKDVFVTTYDMPLIGNDIDEDSLADLLAQYAVLGAHVFVESVHAMPKQGSVSMFTFGKGFGIIRGILAALKMPRTYVTPQAWKKELMQGIRDKDESRARAMQLFPQMRKDLARKRDIGRSDALLIAEHGRRSLQPNGGSNGNIGRKKTKAS